MPKSKKRNKPYNAEKARLRLKNGVHYFLYNQAYMFVDNIQREMQQNACSNHQIWLAKHEKVLNGSTDLRDLADILVVLKYYKIILETKEYHYCIYQGVDGLDSKKLCAFMAINELEDHKLLIERLMQRFLNIEGVYENGELIRTLIYKDDDYKKIGYKINDLSNWIEHLEFQHFEKIHNKTDEYLRRLKRLYHQIYENNTNKQETKNENTKHR